jgi:hypothetical protein
VLALGVATAGIVSGSARTASAQETRPPEAGGHTNSLGQPQRWHWQAGLGAGANFAGPSTDLMLRAVAGGYHSTLNPVTKLAELGMEAYGGVRGRNIDGGVRGILQVPYFSAGIGADYNLRDGRLDMLVTMHTPVRRGGLLTRGTLLRLDWYPLLRHSFTVGVTAPIADPLAGRNRPVRDYVVVAGDFPTPASHHATDSLLAAGLDSLQVSADWLRRLVVPFLDQDGRNAMVALGRTSHFAAMLGARLAGRSVDTEVRFFHQQLEDVFTAASGSRVTGMEVARHSRVILLEEILLPYDALVGRKKRHDTLRTLSVAARGRFGQWVAASGAVPPDRLEDVLFAFQRVTEILEHERKQAAKEWDDPRLVWLPLQYALLPEDADEQAELDSLIERVTGLSFTEHNHITYAANLQFHWELLQMIKETQNYHVLWIHDFPAVAPDSGLDWASLEVVQGYLAALTERVQQYDSTRTLPSYFIFLDQHYYEQRKSRVWMRVLEDPLRASTSLPFGSQQDRAGLTEAVQRLRFAVLNSRVLQAEAREYGDDWLRNRVKVHVNITNRVDASFWGGGLISSVFGYPDDVMRDHRKMAFRDVSEDDPFGGVAILTGMGVGQQYLGPGWDDRSLILQGPVLLELKRAARELLLSQGLVEADLPLPLRARLIADDAIARLAARPDASRFDARALVVVNGTGYLPKPLNAAKALLYSLMPRGSVIKVPDSLWNSTFYAGLLVGASLRGAHVLIIAPARDNAPSNGFPQLARAYELLTRLLLVRGQMGEAITAADGELRIGLYALPVDQRGFASRAERWARQMDSSSFLRNLMPFAPGLEEMVGEAGRDSSDLDHSIVPLQPKLHQKVQFLATGEFWRAVTAAPEWPQFMATYLRYRRATYSPTERYAAARDLPDTLDQIARRLILATRTTSRAASFAFLGSQNQDYRGMFMDGEVGVLFTGAASLVPLVDLVFMVGTVTWIDDQATLDRLLPPVGELRRRIARITKDGV